jgi:hypothetical protein
MWLVFCVKADGRPFAFYILTIPFRNCAAIFPNQQAKRGPKKFNPMLMPPIRDLVAAHDMI